MAAILAAALGACDSEPPAPIMLGGPPPSCEATLGCVTHANIAALVDRPSDLSVPRREHRRDSIRRETVLTAWRGESGPSPKPVAPSTGSPRP